MDLEYTSIRISPLLFVLQLDFDDLHAVDVRVIPGRHVDTVNAGEVHPVRALGLPVYGPGVASQYVPDQAELEGGRNWLRHTFELSTHYPLYDV